MTDKTIEKYFKLYAIYLEVYEASGKYGPYLSKTYFIENTTHEAISRGIDGASRASVYRALKFAIKNKYKVFHEF